MLASAFVSEGAVPAPVGPVGDTISGSAFSDRQLTHPRTHCQPAALQLACLLADRSIDSLTARPKPAQQAVSSLHAVKTKAPEGLLLFESRPGWADSRPTSSRGAVEDF